MKRNARQIFFMTLVALPLSIITHFVLFSPAFAEEFVEITVAKGDYLIKIVQEHLETPAAWEEIARINHLKNPDLIYPNQILLIPVRLLRGIPTEGVVTWLQGTASVQARDGQEWVPLHLHDRIKEGSKIRTGEKSAVEVVFENDTFCFQKAETLTGFLKMRKKGDSCEQRLFLDRGRTITRILKATGREPRFEIETPSTVCAARGTVFRTSVDAFDVARFEVLEGQTTVEAMRRKVVVSEGEGAVVRRGSPPEKPRKLLPPPAVKLDDTPLRKLPFRLRWDPVDGAATYRIWVTKDREGKETLYENILSASEIAEIRDLDDGTYFIHALSIDEIGLEGLPSAPKEISVRVNPLPPSITVPAQGGEFKEKPLQFSWLPAKGAARYQLQIAEDPSFVRVIDDSTTAGTTFETDTLDYGSFYVRIRSVAQDDYEGEWSDPVGFTLLPTPSTTPPEPTKEGSFLTFLGITTILGLIFALLP